jgi:hypothetical protein
MPQQSLDPLTIHHAIVISEEYIQRISIGFDLNRKWEMRPFVKRHITQPDSSISARWH